MVSPTAVAGRPAPRTRLTAPARLTASALAAVLVAALLTAAGIALAPSASASAGAFVSMINSARASAGLPALASRGDLASVAATWSASMASSGTLAHNPRLASQVAGYRYVGENVGYGPDAATVHRAFMASASHRANILDRDYTEVGVAVVSSGGRLWVTEVFRAPSGSARTQAQAPASARPAAPAASSKAAASPTGGGRSSATARATPAPPPPPPPPSPEELLRERARAAVAGPGAARAGDPVQQALRFAAVLRATHG